MFRDVQIIRGDRPVVSYRTGMMVYEESFDDGRWLARGWNGSGFMLNVLDSMPTRLNPDAFAEPHAFDLEVNGASLNYVWRCGDITAEEVESPHGGTDLHVAVVLTHAEHPFRVTVHTLLDGSELFTRWLTLENLADAPVNISALAPLSGGLTFLRDWRSHVAEADPRQLFTLGYFDKAIWGHEGLYRRYPLPNAIYTVAGRHRRQRHRHPFFTLEDHTNGAIWIAQMAWSGGYSFDFDLNADGGDAALTFRMGIDSPNPLLVLGPGEAFDSPRVCIGMLHAGLDDAVNAMHAHLRRSYFTLPEARGLTGGLVEAGMGPERLMDVTATKYFADTAAAVGAETLIIDAGWYCPPGTAVKEWHPRSGDWYPDPDRYPNGIGEIRDYIHEKGLLFGLWLDLERIGASSKLYAEHPDWAAKHFIEGRHGSMLDLARDDVAEWVENELARVIEKYQIDLFRLDYNIGWADVCYAIPAATGGRECGTMKYYRNINRIYRNLRERYPDVVFENCAGGGGRTNLGFVENFTHSWVSDHQTAPRGVAITNGMTMALPPERVDRLASGMNSHTRGSLAHTIRQTLFGRPTTNSYGPIGSPMNPNQIDLVRRSYAIYKTEIRPYAADGKIFHHTPEIWESQPKGTCILERASADGCHAVIGVFTLSDAARDGGETVIVYPRGLDVSKRYMLTFDNSGKTTTADGFALVNEGIRVTLGAALSSELLVLRALEA